MNQKDNSIPRKGMNRDSHPSELQKEEYSFAMNLNLSDENGNGQVIAQNESSNYKCSNFKEGYFVLGHKYDMNNDRVYFFLKNPTTDCSEIGYINVRLTVSQEEIEEVVCGCDIKVVKGSPLEDNEQVGYCTYETILSDCCDSFPDAPKCLNFDLAYPIHESNVEIKDEQTGIFMYFTDGLNPQRRIQLDNLSQYYEVDEACQDPTPGCLQCDKMRIFRLHEKFCLEADAIQAGGNLRAGLYEVTAAYCLADGSEVGDYMVTTNPIPIFDFNNRILDQPNLDYETNFSIRVKLTGLDTAYKYFKVVVHRRDGLQGSSTYNMVGVFPTTTDTVTIPTLKNAQTTISREELFRRSPIYKTARGLTSGRGHLFQFGLESQREMNLQPVVNLMGAFAKWATVRASERLYEFGDNVSNFTSCMRDEVLPYAIRFYTNSGFETASFPLVPRPPKADELIEYVDENGNITAEATGNKNVESIIDLNPSCVKTGRRYRWQYENTADEGEEFCVVEGDGEVTYDVTKRLNCFVREGENLKVVETVASGSVVLPIGQDLVTYINNNRDILDTLGPEWNDIVNALNETYDAEVCTVDVGDNCSTPEIESVFIFPITTDTEVPDPFFPEPTDFPRLTPPSTCTIYTSQDDERFEDLYMEPSETVLERVDLTNTACTSAVPVSNCDSAFDQTFHLANKGQVGANTNLLTTHDSTPGTGYEDKVHSNALWYEVDFADNDRILFEISPMTTCSQSDDNSGSSIRITVLDGCTGSLIDSQIITNLTSTNDPNKYIVLEKIDFTDNAIIAIDSEIFERTIGPNQVFTLRPPCGCFKICSRVIEEVNQVDFTNLTFGKRIFYTTTCEYTSPVVTADCKPFPHKKGDFAYWESEFKYPCNKELFDSSELSISETDIPEDIRSEFEDYYVDSVSSGNYVLSSEANFQDKNIRHYKYPSSTIVPFMDTTVNQEFTEAVIYPIGFHLSNDVIEAFLDIAVKNNLITIEERASITKYEILRGDRRGNKSVIAKGVLFDTYKYNEAVQVNLPQEEAYYPNYPLNTLGRDSFNDKNHPHNSVGHNLFTFHSPDTHFYKPTLPTEMSLEGYMFGKSLTYFDEVPGHPKFTVLGNRARILASTLATAEVTFQMILQGADWASAGFGSPFGSGSVGSAIFAGVVVASAIANSAVRWHEYRKQWVETFMNIGKPQQFAYYSATLGHYNYFLPNSEDNSLLRSVVSSSYLRPGRWRVQNRTGQLPININNQQRENSVLLNLGVHNDDYKIIYPDEYKNYDNYNEDSTSSTRAEGMHISIGKASYERNTALPYATLKQYVPGQYGSIYSIQWISTNYCGTLSSDNECDVVFGGDTYISRFAVKRKFPYFLTTAHGLPDQTAFEYSRYFNIPVQRNANGQLNQSQLNNRYYIDYKINTDLSSGMGITRVLPVADETRYRFDIESSSGEFYVTPPRKFYLYSYGFPYFLVESEYNCNFRYAGTQLSDEFYPHSGDLLDMTRQDRVPIQSPESFRINQVYFEPKLLTPFRTLPQDYSRVLYDKSAILDNLVIYSMQDTSETDLFDPWLVYRPLDAYNFDTSFGRLVDLKVIESEQILARFRNGNTVFGAVDLLADRLQSQGTSLGTGGIFSGRNINFNKTPLGHGGTLNTPMVSCKFGHFWADAKRGEVFNMQPGGGNLNSAGSLKSITQGVSKWFKEQLPFKILSVQGMTEADVDNAYNGVGITMGWDERFMRVFLTKKDYIPQNDNLIYQNRKFFVDNEGTLQHVELTDETYFKECSWTIAYSPLTETWISYYSFKPNYYISYNDYFQTGVNNGESTLWSHLPFMSSYQVYYGQRYPFTIEYPITTKATLGNLTSIEYWMDVRKYYNKYDYADITGTGFTDAVVYKNDQNSGQIKLITQKNNDLSQSINYPKYNTDNTEVLQSEISGKWSFNFLYNRIKNEASHLPIWRNDCSNVEKTLDNRLIEYRNKYQDRLRGDYFLVRLSQSEESRYKYIFRFANDNRNYYE